MLVETAVAGTVVTVKYVIALVASGGVIGIGAGAGLTYSINKFLKGERTDPDKVEIELEGLENERIARQSERMRAIDDLISDTQQSNAVLNTEMVQNIKEITTSTTNLSSATTSIREIVFELDEASKLYAEANEHHSTQIDEIVEVVGLDALKFSQITEEMESVKQKLTAKEEELTHTLDMLTLTQTSLTETTKDLQQATQQVTQLLQNETNNDKKNTQLLSKLKTFETAINAASATILSLTQENERISEELQLVRGELAALRANNDNEGSSLSSSLTRFFR